ncbi:MAG: hypothetical protein ACLGI7_09320 [Gammaproteobacteria bacterium]
MTFRSESAGFGSASVPQAFDRTAWWPVIDREGWDHRVVMQLLRVLDQALFGPEPSDESPEDDADG